MVSADCGCCNFTERSSDLHYSISFGWTQWEWRRESKFGSYLNNKCLTELLILFWSIAVNNGVFPLMPYIRLFHLSLSVQPISACLTNDDKMNAIKNCTETQKGIDLIIAHGNATQTNISPLYFVPAIEIDNVSLDIKSIMLPSLTLYPLQEFNQDDQDDLLYHFSRDFCKRYRAKYHKKLSNC